MQNYCRDLELEKNNIKWLQRHAKQLQRQTKCIQMHAELLQRHISIMISETYKTMTTAASMSRLKVTKKKEPGRVCGTLTCLCPGFHILWILHSLLSTQHKTKSSLGFFILLNDFVDGYAEQRFILKVFAGSVVTICSNLFAGRLSAAAAVR